MSDPKLLQEYKSEYSDRKGIHFNSAGLSPISRSVAMSAAALVSQLQTEASFADPELVHGIGRARADFAEFVGAEPDCVAFLQNCASAISQVALGFPLKPGDRVVTVDQEYSSSFYPWKVACERSGAELVVVKSEPNLQVSLEKILAAITPGTKLVGVSWVQFQTGAILDLKTLGDHCHSVGAFLSVDGIQGVGQLPFSMKDLPVDALCGGSHKWLSSIMGQGYLALKPELMKLLQPVTVGGGTFNRFGTFADPELSMVTHSKKFEAGGFAFVPLFALQSAVKVQSVIGVQAIAEEISRLSAHLREGLVGSGVKLVTPMKQRGGITSFEMAPDREARLLKRCQEERIAIVKRGNLLRTSLHAFCTDSEIDHFLTVLRGTE